MKTLFILAAFGLIFSFKLNAQRNVDGNRITPSDRIDRVKIENPVRNPDIQREPIREPYRPSEQPVQNLNPTRPISPNNPTPFDGPTTYCPPEPPQPIIIIDNAPDFSRMTNDQIEELGINHLNMDEFNEAIKCFNYLLNDDPLDYEIYCLRGRAYHGLELFIKAKSDFNKSIRINKQYADAYYYLGLTEISLDDMEAAIVDFEIAADMGNVMAIKLMKKYFSK